MSLQSQIQSSILVSLFLDHTILNKNNVVEN